MFLNLARLLVLVIAAGTAQFADAADKPTHPVVFVPGILGSKLCDENDRVVWGESAAQSLTNFYRLELSPANPEKLKKCGLVEQTQVLGPLYAIDAYVKLIAQFSAWGLSVKSGNLFIFDYDWRLSNTENAVELEQFVRSKLGADAKFNIVAHSMGGIVSRLYVERPEGRQRVNKVVYLGTPFLGSMNTLGTLSEGWGKALNWIAGGVGTIRRVSLSFPSYLELLPRYQRCCELKHASGSYEQIDIFDPQVWQRSGWLVAPHETGDGFVRFSNNLRRAESISQILSRPAPLTVAEIKFAGDPKPTRLQFVVQAGKLEPSSSNWFFSFERGDGTVPVWSAARSPSLNSVAGSMQSFAEHTTIFDDKWVRKELQIELFTAEAIRTRPIAASGNPQVSVVLEGTRREIPLRALRIVPKETYVVLGDDVSARVTLHFGDETPGLPRGIYRPRFEMRQGSLRRTIEAEEVTTDDEAANNKLSFFMHTASAGLVEGVGEIVVALPGVTDEPTFREYVVLLTR